MSENRFRDDELVEALHDAVDDIGRVPTVHEMRAHSHSPDPNTYSERFGGGSWTDALKEVGFEPRHEKPTYTDEELLTILRLEARASGQPLSSRTFQDDPNLPYYGTYTKRFGSFPDAVREAGLRPHPASGERYSTDYVRETFREALEGDDSLRNSKNWIESDDTPLAHSTVVSHFGSWREGVREVGFEPVRVGNRMTDEKLEPALDYLDSHPQAKTYEVVREADVSKSVAREAILQHDSEVF